MACDELTALYQQVQKGNSEKFTVESQANFFVI